MKNQLDKNRNTNTTDHKFVVELVGQQRVRQLTEVELKQWADAVNVSYVNVVRQ